MSMGDVIGAILFSALFIPVVVLAELLKKRGLSAEATRKTIHIGGGLLSLALPLLVRSVWLVAGMSITLALIFFWTARIGLLASAHGVQRNTRGTEYFPLAVFLLYLITYEHYWIYVSSILVLTVADAFAALIGTRYGRIHYDVEDSSKSLEGSVFFLLIAFLALHLPMLLMTDLPRAVCVLAALLVAVLVTGFEAVSVAGSDNLFVPLGTAVILSKISTKPLEEIVYQNLSLVVLSVVVLIMARRARAFNAGATIMFILFVYGAWSLGSELWALPILVGFALFMLVRRFLRGGTEQRNIRVMTLFRLLVFPLLILVVANMTGLEQPLFPFYLLICAATLGLAIRMQRVACANQARESSCFSAERPEANL